MQSAKQPQEVQSRQVSSDSGKPRQQLTKNTEKRINCIAILLLFGPGICSVATFLSFILFVAVGGYNFLFPLLYPIDFIMKTLLFLAGLSPFLCSVASLVMLLKHSKTRFSKWAALISVIFNLLLCIFPSFRPLYSILNGYSGGM